MTYTEIEQYVRSFRVDVKVTESTRKSTVIECIKGLSRIEEKFGKSELIEELIEIFLYTDFDEQKATSLLYAIEQMYYVYPQFASLLGKVSIIKNIRSKIKERIRLKQNLSKLESGEFSFTTLKALMSAANRVVVAYEKTGDQAVKELAVLVLGEVHDALLCEEYNKTQINPIITLLLG